MLVGAEEFEPPALCSPDRLSNYLRKHLLAGLLAWNHRAKKRSNKIKEFMTLTAPRDGQIMLTPLLVVPLTYRDGRLVSRFVTSLVFVQSVTLVRSFDKG